MPREMLSWRRALQFAPDASLEPSWFRNYEGSHYGGENSLDLEAIDRPDNSYDFISLSSVLEFVPDDRKAFHELLRIGSPDCIIHCTFAPFAEVSRHFDEPHGAFGRYHVYGPDLVDRFETAAQDLTVLSAAESDPATAQHETLHFFCKRVSTVPAMSATRTGSPS